MNYKKYIIDTSMSDLETQPLGMPEDKTTFPEYIKSTKKGDEAFKKLLEQISSSNRT